MKLLALFLLWVAAGVAVMVFAPAAAAGPPYPGEHPAPAGDRARQLARDVVEPFLAARLGLGACPAGVELLIADSLADVDEAGAFVAAGRGLDCRVWLRSGALRIWRAGGDVQDECALIAHEYVHALGWMPTPAEADPNDPRHARSGLMAARGAADAPPGDCVVAQQRYDRGRRRAARAARRRARVARLLGHYRRPRAGAHASRDGWGRR